MPPPLIPLQPQQEPIAPFHLPKNVPTENVPVPENVQENVLPLVEEVI